MTKSKTIIATLGIVAGLGAAALPLASYAADPQTVNGNVELQVEVLPAIAMTIAGNNDAGTHAVTGTAYVGADGIDVFNPSGIASTAESSEGAGDGVIQTLDSHPIPTANTTGVSSSYTELLPNAVLNDATFKSTVTIYTNSTSGYNLNLGPVAATNVDLVQQVISGTADTITASDTIVAGQGHWGYVVTTTDGTLDKTVAGGKDAIPVISAGEKIAHEDVKTSNGTAYDVAYKVSTRADQSTGTYTTNLVYTATTK